MSSPWLIHYAELCIRNIVRRVLTSHLTANEVHRESRLIAAGKGRQVMAHPQRKKNLGDSILLITFHWVPSVGALCCSGWLIWVSRKPLHIAILSTVLEMQHEAGNMPYFSQACWVICHPVKSLISSQMRECSAIMAIKIDSYEWFILGKSWKI